VEEREKPGVNKRNNGLSNYLFNPRLLVAIWSGKIIMKLTRILGRGGTTLPGRIALFFAPQISAGLASQLRKGSLIITGTNGKTTTTALINNILKETGYKCIHNQSGSNLTWGVASTLIESASWLGKLHEDWAVIEVDEGSFPEVTKSVNPRGIVVTNIFRDQLDRFGEIDHIQNSIKKGMELLPESSFKAINADDPSLAGIQPQEQKNIIYYGLELDSPSYPFQNTGRDIKTCPLCLKVLAYNKLYYAHLGHYYCPSCSYRRPEPEIKLTGYQVTSTNSSELKLNVAGKSFKTTVPLLGTYNLYNILAAVACARGLEIPLNIIATALQKAVPSFGRMEQFHYEEKNIIMALVKNPVGTNEVLRTILDQKGKIDLLIAINDNIADGTDISWLWDVDFEQLLKHQERLNNITVSGSRAWDMAVRLKYAGLDPGKIEVEENLHRALHLSLQYTKPNGKLFILPNYTAMLEIHKDLNRLGLGKSYWDREAINK